MKKIMIAITAIISVLFFGIFIMGCSGGGDGNNTGNTASVQGKVLILQAYGNAGGDSPAGVSHSFVELYNITDEAINLSGISLYYANGIRGEDVTEDEAWKKIALTGTIPAKGSFLILGARHSDLSSTRYKIADGYGDINDDNLSLSRRGFKAAVIKGSEPLTVRNPFNTDGNGAKISGYIDMVGAVNNPGANPPDNIFGYEAAPARISASEAVRRADLTDTDNNSTDFIAARYALTGDGAFTNEMLEVRKPRNSSEGAWEPFAAPADPPAHPDITSVDYSKLKLNEISGVGNDPDKFYELINIGGIDIPLYDCKIYYSANSNTGGTLPAGKGNLTWTGSASQTIEAGKLLSLIGRNAVGSFTTGLTPERILIITLEDPAGNVIDRFVRAADTGDYAISDRSFSRIPDGTGNFYFTQPTPNAVNGVSDAGLKKLPDNPPFITNFGIDISSVTPSDTVTVSATVTTTTSTTLTVVIKWAVNGTAKDDIPMTAIGNVYSAGIPAQAAGSAVTYKVSAANALGETNFTATRNYTVVSVPVELMILQANTYGNNNGGAAGFARSLVELYNNADTAINLTTGNYYLHIGNNTAWTNVIKLEGSIPAKSSFLIVDNTTTTASNTNSTPRAALPAADQQAAFVIDNTNFKVALLKNQNSILSVNNPFTEAALRDDYVDMLGTGSANGYETQAASASRPQVPRRTSLADTDNNKNDFAQWDARGIQSGSNGIPNDQLYKFWPRNAVAGAWNPITGLPQVNPVVP